MFESLLVKKRDKETLNDEQISQLVTGIVNESLTPVQLGSLLMSLYQSRMTGEELTSWTKHIRDSGTVINKNVYNKISVDKHSTGGVGDKLSFIVAPLLAASGVCVPMISGRSLGHTGGTLDKFEAIEGVNTLMDTDKFVNQVNDIGLSIASQSDDLCPADRIMYAGRSQTGTVANPDLIAASIMSKKMAEGLTGLVLDVKVGKGAFLKTFNESAHLAQLMLTIGKAQNVNTICLLTNMDAPLGNYVGNSGEILEAVDVLKNAGPKDVTNLALTLAAYGLVAGGAVTSVAEGKQNVTKALHTGAGAEIFEKLVWAQGGPSNFLTDPVKYVGKTKHKTVVRAPIGGTVVSLDALKIAHIVPLLNNNGADKAAGVKLVVKPGAKVEQNDALAVLETNNFESENLIQKVADAYVIKPGIQLVDGTTLLQVLH